MIRFCWLTFLAIVYSCASFAQSPGDSAIHNDIFNDFSCTALNSNNVQLQWSLHYYMNADYFIVERSSDGEHFETVSILKITDTLSGFSLVDNAPYNGAVFYRIRYIDKSGRSVYSGTGQVSLSGAVDFKFYPNPADRFLIIQTGHNIDVQIWDASGLLRLTKQLQPGLQIINVSPLEKGTYILKVADKESNRVVSEQLLKN